MKKFIAAFLVLGMFVALAGPAEAKKKKGPKPYVSEEGTINVGHPVFYGNSGTVLAVTAQEFLNSCSIPQSNGLDAYVFEVPADWQKATGSIQAFGSEGTQVAYDLDMFLYDSSCTQLGVFNSTNADELGVLSKGTAFVLLYNYTGDPVSVHYELKAL
jgi:extracellular elastinolytic metalloproteinase